MKDEDFHAFHIRNERLEGGIYTVAELWCTDPAAAKQQYGPIASWNTSEITDMYRLFADRVNFNDDISRWDVSSVKSMNGMLNGATSFNRDISGWDVSKVTDMAYMFDRATSFNGDLSQWNVSNVTDMIHMLRGATSFNGDLSQWNVSNVTDMRNMLSGATSFTHQLGGAWSTSTADKAMTRAACSTTAPARSRARPTAPGAPLSEAANDGADWPCT